jgi:uncharacterized protein (DUF488 family)
MDPDSAPGPVRVYTVGHSNLSTQELAERLQRHQITTVVDVRSFPYSRFAPQHNRETLRKTLEAHGILYRYAGDRLGGRPKDPDLYRSGAPPSGDAKISYAQVVDYERVAEQPEYKDAISKLMQWATEAPTAIMCSEEDPTRCHRHLLITRTLLSQGAEVLHIRATTTTPATEAPAQLALFREK